MAIILPEEFKVGYFDSNIAYGGIDVTPERIVTDFELELPLGIGGVSYNGDEEASIEPNMVVCAKPGQVRYTKTPYKAYFIKFPSCDGKVCEFLKTLPNFIKTYRYDKYYEKFRKVCVQHSLKDRDNFAVYSIIFEIIDMMAKDCINGRGKEQILKDGSVAVQSAVRYIKEHLTEELTLEKIAATQGYAPTYFHKLFKTAMGKTLRSYVEELRLEKAITMLLETDYTVTKVAYECGFSSQSYFNFVFKHRMNKSPRKYIQEKQEESANSYKATEE